MIHHTLSLRHVRVRTIEFCLLVSCLALPSLCAGGTGNSATLWEKNLSQEVLAVLNADSNRITFQEPGAESVSMVNMSVAAFGQSPLQILGSSSGVLLLAARDKDPFVHLVALDVSSGEKLWQIPCTGLPLSDLPKERYSRTTRIISTFMTVGNQVIVVQQPGAGKADGDGPKVLVSYDLRTGAELWRSQANPLDYMEMFRQMNPDWANKKGLRGWAMKKAMKDMNRMAPPLANYFLLPARDLLMKTSTDQTGTVLEALDLDTGQSVWTLHFSPVTMDYSRIKKTRAMQVTRNRGAEELWNTALERISSGIRGDYFFMGCTGALAEASQGTGQCSSLRAYSITSGRLAWEFQQSPQEALGWIATREVVLVRLSKTIAALKLSTGEKLYEISDSRGPILMSAFDNRTYADGDLVYWFDRKGKEKKLIALDVKSGTLLWQTSISKEKVVGFIVRDPTLVIATESEVILIDKSSGKEVLRQRPIGAGSIRTVSALDPQSILVLGDNQMVRYEVASWKEVYRAVIPPPKRSVLADMFLVGLAVGLSMAPTYQPGPTPGTFVRTPAWLSPGGMANVYNLLSLQSTTSIRKLERQSSNFCYFMSGEAIHRVDVADGKLEEVGQVPAKDGLLALDESQGIGCLIRNRTLTAIKVPLEERARQAAKYLNALERGSWGMRRAAKLESGDRARSVAAYLLGAKDFDDALAAGNEPREKAVVHLALGRVYDRLSILAADNSQSWKDKAIKEYNTVVNLTCAPDKQGLNELCPIARQSLEGK